MGNFDFSGMMNSAGIGIFALVTIPFIIVGLILVYIALRARRRVRDSMNWATTMGTVLFSAVDERTSYSSESGTTTSYYPKVVYEYRVMGQRFQSDRFNLGEVGIGNYNQVAAKVAQYPQGAPIQVYYNPANPVECALERVAPSSNVMLLVVVVIFAILGCTGIMVAGGFALMGDFMNTMTTMTNTMLTEVPR
jgi:hypothetical protein